MPQGLFSGYSQAVFVISPHWPEVAATLWGVYPRTNSQWHCVTYLEPLLSSSCCFQLA
jgi:hypothetical protein